MHAIPLAIARVVGCLVHLEFHPELLMDFKILLHRENHHSCCMNGYMVQMGSRRHDHDESFHHGTFVDIGFPNAERDNDFDQVCNHKSDDNQREV